MGQARAPRGENSAAWPGSLSSSRSLMEGSCSRVQSEHGTFSNLTAVERHDSPQVSMTNSDSGCASESLTPADRFGPTLGDIRASSSQDPGASSTSSSLHGATLQ